MTSSQFNALLTRFEADARAYEADAEDFDQKVEAYNSKQKKLNKRIRLFNAALDELEKGSDDCDKADISKAVKFFVNLPGEQYEDKIAHMTKKRKKLKKRKKKLERLRADLDERGAELTDRIRWLEKWHSEIEDPSPTEASRSHSTLVAMKNLVIGTGHLATVPFKALLGIAEGIEDGSARVGEIMDDLARTDSGPSSSPGYDYRRHYGAGHHHGH